MGIKLATTLAETLFETVLVLELRIKGIPLIPSGVMVIPLRM